MRKLKLFISILFLLFSTQPSQVLFADRAFWREEGIIEDWAINAICPAVPYVVNEANGSSLSGILIRSKKGPMVLLTNSHFINDIEREKQSIVAYMMVNDKLIRWKCKFENIDRSSDLAMFTFSYEENDTTFRESVEWAEANNYGLCISSTTAGDHNSITRGRNILFLGFPLGFGIDRKKEPIARYGHISSRPDSDGMFLIDAMVNNGNSGSPVFVRDGEDSNGMIICSYRFVGIIKGYIPAYVEYKSNNGDSIKLPHNSGLGIVIGINKINIFMEKSGY